MAASVCVTLLLSCVFATITPTSQATSSEDSSSSSPLTCPKEKFIASAPRSTRLSFCGWHSKSTCCDASHTDAIAVGVSPLWQQEGVSDDCRRYSAMMSCSICDGQQMPVCKRSCKRWYNACSATFFKVEHGRAKPCADDDIVCAALTSIAKTPTEFCEMSGLSVAKGAGSDNGCFNPEEPAWSNTLIPVPRVGGRPSSSSSSSSSSTASSSSTSSSSSSSSSSPSEPSEAERMAEGVQQLLDSIYQSIDIGLVRPVRRWYRRAWRAMRANPEKSALALVFGALALFFVRFLNRAGMLSCLARRCRKHRETREEKKELKHRAAVAHQDEVRKFREGFLKSVVPPSEPFPKLS